jgi:tetratricopeptide (TPR) repeat protein
VLGDRAGVDVELGLMGSLADELRQPAQHWHQTSLCTALALMEGRFEAAEELISQAAARGQEALSWNAAVSERIALFVLRREQGRLHELEDLLARSVHEFPALRRFRCALAHLYAEVGREEDAVRVLDDLLSCDLAHEYVDAEWLFAMTLLADAVAAVGDVAGAERLYAILRPYEALYADAPVEGTFGSVARGLGVLATTGGRFDDAERHFEHALHIERRMRARPWLAHTQHGYAAMRLQRARPGDAHRARDLLGEAVCTYGTLGMGTWADRAAALVPADGVSGEVHYP